MSTADRVAERAWVSAGLIAVVAALIGFVWLPSIQEGVQGGVWDAICRAVGITRPAGAAPLASTPEQIATALAWNVDTLRIAVSGDAKRGNALAAPCAGCHGANGISPSDAFPNIAGLPAEVMYKQLEDYRSGKRQNPIMQGMAAPMSDQAIADLASHFAALPRGGSKTGAGAPALVLFGSPLRSIAPCAACHGPVGRKLGAPPLSGQKGAYIKAQLEAFAAGARRNDTNQQMREVARALSAEERDALAAWYDEKRK